MGSVVLDSNVVLGLLDPGDAHHQRVVAELRRLDGVGARFVLPTLVLAEVLVRAARVAPETVETRHRDLVEAFGRTRTLDDAVAVRAARLRAEHSWLRMPDALVIATGVVEDADSILTTDRRWAGVDQRVQVLVG